MKSSVTQSSIKTPPMNAYYFDLIWIQKYPGKKGGEYYKLIWMIADIPEQQEWKGTTASMLVPTVPTPGNKYGVLLRALLGRDLVIDEIIDTDDLILGRYRALAGLVVSPNKEKDKAPYRNIEAVIEGTVKKGVGIGYGGVYDGLVDEVNVWLAQKGLPLLVKKDNEDKASTQAASSHAGGVVNGNSKPPNAASVGW